MRYTLAILVLLSCVSCGGANPDAPASPSELKPGPASQAPAAAVKQFSGTVVWATVVEGAGAEASTVKLVKESFPERAALLNSPGRTTMINTGGTGPGTWTVNRGAPPQRGVYLAKEGPRTLEEIEDMDGVDDKVKAFMPAMFKTELQDLGDSETILGRKAQHFKVTKSGFLRGDMTVELWIDDSVAYPPSRLRLTTDSPYYTVITPYPVQFPMEKGLVLKAVVVDQGVKCTFTAESIDETAPVHPPIPEPAKPAPTEK